jgi:hypothetical protein
VRHSCASLLYANGVSLKEIQEWLGHSGISTTSNIYTHLDFSSKVASANAIIGVYPSWHPSGSGGMSVQKGDERQAGMYRKKRKSPQIRLYRGFKSDWFLVPKAGVEPARVLSPPDFESGASANSTTSA